MAQYTRIEVALEMKNTGLVPVFYNQDPEVCKRVIKACYDGGVRVFEFTNRGDFAHEVFNILIKYAISELPGLMLGAGSIPDAGTASIYIQSGSNFIVSPFLKEDIAIVCNRRKILWMPGCGSVTEISRAEELGAEIVKIFPAAQLGGPEFVAALKGPCPWTSVMPTGGVSTDETNLKSWFKAGVACVGIGSQLFTSDIIIKKDYKKLTTKVKDTLKIISGII